MTSREFDAAPDPLDVVATLSEAFATEAGKVDPESAVANPIWATAYRMVDHVGGIYRWVSATVLSGARAQRSAHAKPDPAHLEEWFRESRELVLATLRDTDPARECWTIPDPTGKVGFWRRRMMHETTMHLGDLRTAFGGGYVPAPEAPASVFADGIAEHFGVYLPLSRGDLARLPAPLALHATDAGVRWTILEDWKVVQDDGQQPGRPGATTVSGPAGWLAAFTWDRATLDGTEQLAVSGDRAVADAYTATPVRP